MLMTQKLNDVAWLEEGVGPGVGLWIKLPDGAFIRIPLGELRQHPNYPQVWQVPVVIHWPHQFQIMLMGKWNQ